MSTDSLQSYLAARQAKEQADRNLARAEGALAQTMARLQEQTGLPTVEEVQAMLVQEQQKLARLEKAFQEGFARFQQEEGKRLEEA